MNLKLIQDFHIILLENKYQEKRVSSSLVFHYVREQLDINEANLAPAGVAAVRDTGGAAGAVFVGVVDCRGGKARARPSAPCGHAPEEQGVP